MDSCVLFGHTEHNRFVHEKLKEYTNLVETKAGLYKKFVELVKELDSLSKASLEDSSSPTLRDSS